MAGVECVVIVAAAAAVVVVVIVRARGGVGRQLLTVPCVLATPDQPSARLSFDGTPLYMQWAFQ